MTAVWTHTHTHKLLTWNGVISSSRVCVCLSVPLRRPTAVLGQKCLLKWATFYWKVITWIVLFCIPLMSSGCFDLLGMTKKNIKAGIWGYSSVVFAQGGGVIFLMYSGKMFYVTVRTCSPLPGHLILLPGKDLSSPHYSKRSNMVETGSILLLIVLFLLYFQLDHII